MIAKVLSWTAKAFSGDVEADPGGGAVVRSQLAAPSGTDAPPLPGDFAVLVHIQGAGRTVQVGGFDSLNAPVAAAGEHRIYARDAEGAPIVSLHIKKDGSAVLSNAEGSATLGADGSHTLTKGGASVVVAADESLSMSNGSGGVQVAAGGEVTINGVKFSTSGAVEAPGLVKGLDFTATNVNVTLSTHTHNMGAIPKPDPGT